MFRIQHLQWMGIAAAAIGCLLLGGAAVLSNFNDYQRHSHGAYELERFSALLEAVNAISAERGPANSAMAATDAEAAARHAELATKRAETDAAIYNMEAVFKDTIAGQECDAAHARLQSELANGRRKVDFAASSPFAERDPRAIGRGMLAMFAAADAATKLRDLVSGHIIAETPGLAGELMLANSASTLRDQEGRLGSFVVMALVAPPERDPMYLQRMQAAEGIIRSLWSTSVSLADNLLPDPEITGLVAAVQRDFFDGALLLALDAAENHAEDNSLSPAVLTAEYVPGMRSSELLRTAVIRHAVAAMDRNADNALKALVSAALLTAAILAVLVIVAVVFRRTLFSPLMRLHDDVLALASGDHKAPAPLNGTAREVGNIFNGLDILRQNLAEKRVLEEEQRRLNRRLRRLAETDTLTGQLNRRALLSRVDAMFRRADRIGESLAVVLFDIDHFKVVNDTHGHAVGDEVLSGVARLIDGALRTGDTLARIGGEEFVLILRRADDITAHNLLERLRILLSETAVQGKLGLKVTASFGAAMRPAGSAQDWDEMFSLADQRLYMAKGAGRNCIVTEGFSPQTRQRA
ncbi:sensor domain-containing diguanylate cyclase [Devosia sp. Root685]|uniref:GGDEF domain-containing protein n=1 Tax=Devosia sp. Root685 TaxID=1736587 RepID=UPI0012E34A20|nr:GGDEF domain-containing protein [Devosia sp. Root685]